MKECACVTPACDDTRTALTSNVEQKIREPTASRWCNVQVCLAKTVRRWQFAGSKHDSRCCHTNAHLHASVALSEDCKLCIALGAEVITGTATDLDTRRLVTIGVGTLHHGPVTGGDVHSLEATPLTEVLPKEM